MLDVDAIEAKYSQQYHEKYCVHPDDTFTALCREVRRLRDLPARRFSQGLGFGDKPAGFVEGWNAALAAIAEDMRVKP